MKYLTAIIIALTMVGTVSAACQQKAIAGHWTSIGMADDSRFIFCDYYINKKGVMQKKSNCGYLDNNNLDGDTLKIKGTMKVVKGVNVCAAQTKFTYSGYPVEFFFVFNKHRNTAIGTGGVLGLTLPMSVQMVK
tara:strand:+ start:1520 stop:1921 length:402 start_codon:yes stop_codon:yes gene_type:complete